MKPAGGTCLKKRVWKGKLERRSVGTVPRVPTIPQTRVTRGMSPQAVPQDVGVSPVPHPTVHLTERKRLQIRKQLVIILHAMVCKRRARDLDTTQDEITAPQQCNVPLCGVMKNVLEHVKRCDMVMEMSHFTHCASTKQILAHWKDCCRMDCLVCVDLRKILPTSLLQVVSNPLSQAEIMQRVARHQLRTQLDQTVPEYKECEE